MVAGILHKLGCPMGERLLGGDWSNPDGHFEDFDASLINRRILADAGGAWWRPPSAEMLAKVDRSEEIKAHVATREAKPLWGMKDPRLILTIDHWLPHLSNPTFFVVNRKPEDVAASLNRRNGFGYGEALTLYAEYHRRQWAFMSEHEPQCVVLWYDLVRQDGAKWVGIIAHELCVDVTDAAIAHVRR